MKQQIEALLKTALTQLQSEGVLDEVPSFIQVESAKDKVHGDFASNIALVLAKAMKQAPRNVAELIVKALPTSSSIKKVDIAGPGFINFFLTDNAMTSIVETILAQKELFGRSKIGREKRVLVEFLSSNPTGPLHVGHGRGGAFGSVVSNLLDAVGFKTYREYYVNDAGRQMDILTTSIWLRYLTLCGEEIIFPANAYRGEYVIDIAKAMHDAHDSHFVVPIADIYKDLPLDEPQGGDKEIYIDAMIAKA